LAGDLSGQLFIWDLPYPFNKDKAPWGKFRHDNWNTGLYEFKPPAPPKAFSLLEPPDRSVVESPRPLFKWEDAKNFDVDSLTYSLYYSTDSTFAEASTTVVSEIRELKYAALSDFSENTNYYWKVKAAATGGFERWSKQSWRFIVDVNAAPVITSRPDTNAYEDRLYEYHILASDEDAADTLQFSLLIQPSWLSVSGTVRGWPASTSPPRHLEVGPKIAWTANADAQMADLVLSGIPRAKNIGDTLVSIQVSDGKGGVSVQTYALHVWHVNHAPTIPFLLVPQNGDTIALSLPAKDIVFAWRSSTDVDPVDSLRYSLKISGASIDTTISDLQDTLVVLNIMPRLAPKTSYKWHVEVTDGLVTVHSDTFLAHTSATIVSVNDDTDHLPERYALYQNYPNPFNSSTTIAYDIPRASVVFLKIYDIRGHEVAAVVHAFQPAGRYRVTLSVDRLASGIYFCRLQTAEFTALNKLAILR
jgi:hypothetical protein